MVLSDCEILPSRIIKFSKKCLMQILEKSDNLKISCHIFYKPSSLRNRKTVFFFTNSIVAFATEDTTVMRHFAKRKLINYHNMNYVI